MKTAYGLKTRTRLDLAETETKVRELLAGEGFGILTEIDVAATLKEKLGVTRDPYRILGARNPQLANQALEAEDDVGLLLVSAELPEGENIPIEFTPSEPGEYEFACQMGMLRGKVVVS